MTENECRIMMVKECRWMKQEVCGDNQREHETPRKRKRRDIIAEILKPLADLVAELGKIVNNAQEPQCR